MTTLVRLDGRHVVAYLTTASAPRVVIPLCAGIDFVGRSPAHSRHAGWTSPYPVEGAQWFTRCETGSAWVVDAASTNQSVIVRAGTPGALTLRSAIERAAADEVGFESIPHRPPAPLDDAKWHAVADGDVLVTAYAALRFTWA